MISLFPYIITRPDKYWEDYKWNYRTMDGYKQKQSTITIASSDIRSGEIKYREFHVWNGDDHVCNVKFENNGTWDSILRAVVEKLDENLKKYERGQDHAMILELLRQDYDEFGYVHDYE